jgi:hypothetical protein
MLKPVNSNDQITAARLVELLNPKSPWNRSLWTLNTVLVIQELLEATEAQRAGILGEDSIKRIGSVLIRLAGKDAGVSEIEKRELAAAIKSNPTHDGLAYHIIKQLGELINVSYLQRWAGALRSPLPPRPERVARSISAHLLHQGFSGEFLLDWWTDQLYKHPQELTLAEIVDNAHLDLALRSSTEFDVLVAFKNAPRSASGFPTAWLQAQHVSNWLRKNSFDVTDVRPSGGLELRIRARDPYSAAMIARDRIDQFVARSSVATKEQLVPWDQIWVQGQRAPLSVGNRRRGVRVKALYREDQIFAESNAGVDAAIDLLSHLENSSPSAAIAGGWAAVESLLAERETSRAEAADRLASLVACSFPRAELTALSYVAEKTCGHLAVDLKKCAENRDRALLVGKAIYAGDSLSLHKHTDKAAYARMQLLLQSPSKALNDIASHVSDAFHRVYRQRNLILHGGRTNSVALSGSLRTAAKLVGAGMDRITHGWYVKGIQPIELAARARIAIALIPDGGVADCVELLGTE